MITATEVKALRERTGCGITECKKALEVCEEDQELAYHWLKYNNCAINLRGMSREDWTMMMAKEALNNSY